MLAMRTGAACPSSDRATEDAVPDGRQKVADLQVFPAISGPERSEPPAWRQERMRIECVLAWRTLREPRETCRMSAQSFRPPCVRVYASPDNQRRN